MPKVSEEFLLARREEIIDACAKLYETMSFKEITLKEIGKVTSFNRTSIYNYFDTKEEIFLALMQREYELWIAELERMMKKADAMTRRELAEALSRSLERRGQLLKLLSMNLYDMEENSRQENLVEFKRVYGKFLRSITGCLDRFCPDMTAADKEDFLYSYCTFIQGIYPYAVVSDKQERAMAEAGVGFVYHSVYELSYKCLCKLLETGKGNDA